VKEKSVLSSKKSLRVSYLYVGVCYTFFA